MQSNGGYKTLADQGFASAGRGLAWIKQWAINPTSSPQNAPPRPGSVTLAAVARNVIRAVSRPRTSTSAVARLPPIAPTTALKALDGNKGRALYVGTLSKLLIPGLRLGLLVAPDHLVDVLQRVRNGTGHRVAQSLQATAADFIGHGHLGTHIRRVKSLYAQRRSALLSAIARQAGERLKVSATASGLHLLAELPQGIDDQALTLAARARQIGAGALSGLFVSHRPPSVTGCCWGLATLPRIPYLGRYTRCAS